MTQPISSFSGKYHFLSNFYPCSIKWEGIIWPSTEHAYQAAKSNDPQIRQRILEAATPAIAKKMGKKVLMRPDWDSIRRSVMLRLVSVKFFGDVLLKEELWKTGDLLLIEGNWWGDTYWGICQGAGENHLGKILMIVRDLITAEYGTFDKALMS